MTGGKKERRQAGRLPYKIGGDEMVLDDVFGLTEPELAEGGQDAALFGNRIGQDHVEGADAIRGDKQQRVGEIEDLAHLAAFEFLDAGDIDL